MKQLTLKNTVQLGSLKLTILEKRFALANKHGVLFHQDKSRPNVSVTKPQKLKVFGWEVFNHPPCSTNVELTDYYSVAGTLPLWKKFCQFE